MRQETCSEDEVKVDPGGAGPTEIACAPTLTCTHTRSQSQSTRAFSPHNMEMHKEISEHILIDCLEH